MAEQTQPDQPASDPLSKVPPQLRAHAIKPGQVLNPKGRPRIGATIIEHINGMAQANLSRRELERIANDDDEGSVRRYAAGRLLILMELGDVADFDDFLSGESTIAQLRKRGVNTRVIKKAKITRKIIGRTGDGDAITEEQREIEFYDRAETTGERLIDRTLGKPVQTVKTDGEDDAVTTIRIVTPLTRGRAHAGTIHALEDSGHGEANDPSAP